MDGTSPSNCHGDAGGSSSSVAGHVPPVSPAPDAATASAARPYRSKKQRPCDGCRRRRVGCFVEQDQKDCTLCRHRGQSCTFNSLPPVKKRRPATSAQASSSSTKGKPIDPWISRSRELPAQTSPVLSPPSLAAIESERFQSTVIPGRTNLWTGNSSDQDVYLLRHLPFDQANRFGHANWRVWKVFPGDSAPAYFTSYPNRLLDANTAMYDYSQVNAMVDTHQHELIGLYYSYVHPSLPILEDRDAFDAAISSGTVPASLVAAVYCSAIRFWHLEPKLAKVEPLTRESLYKYIFSAVSLEARTPSLRTIQALLIYLQITPFHVREPNHPGFWALTSQLVALAQDTGLHVDASEWNINPTEKRVRRILWWAVYMQDKWLAHWLGRPSHIHTDQFHVHPLTVGDFDILMRTTSDYLAASVDAFVRLSRLTVVLSSVLDHFYTVSRNPGVMSPNEALSRASDCQAQLTRCLNELGLGPVLLRPSRTINDYAFVFAYYGIAVSIQRAIFACVGGTSYYDIGREKVLFQNLAGVFEDLLGQDMDGVWLSYCKSNVAIVGSFIITALLSSTDDTVYLSRRATLDAFQGYLHRLADQFDFAALPLLRLNLLLERFTDNGSDDERPDPLASQPTV